MFILVIMFFSAYGEEQTINKNYCLSLGTQFGFVHGRAFELVYSLPGETKGELLSELIWEMKPVFFYGFTLDFRKADLLSSPGFMASISFKSGIPKDSGNIENYDWMSNTNSNLTHYSIHPNKTQELYIFDALLGASIPVKSLFYINPFISGSWMHFSFSGRDGLLKYARPVACSQYCQMSNHALGCQWNGDPFTTYYPIDLNPFYYPYNNTEVIRYKQDWLLIAAGFTIGTNIFSPFSFNLSFQISPFTYCTAVDTHLKRNPPRTFFDYPRMGLFLEPGTSVSFTYKSLELTLEAAYRYIGKAKGDSYYRDDGFIQHYKSTNKTGAGLSVFNTSLLVKVLFELKEKNLWE